MTKDEIKSLRQSLGLNQVQFIAKLGIVTSNPDAARQQVSRWERGERNPSGAALSLLNSLQRKTEGSKR